MRLDLIGNKFDCMKGAVFSALQEKELLQGLVVDAMARPPSCWTGKDFRRYTRYLRLGRAHQIAKHNVQWGTGKRRQYFAELDRYSGRDFFLDPDVGVATSKPGPQHIKRCEALGPLQDQNVVVVYQHGARGPTIEQRVQTVVQALLTCQPSVECLAYMEPRAGLLFLTRQSIRLGDIKACLDGAHLPGSLERFRAKSMLSDARQAN